MRSIRETRKILVYLRRACSGPGGALSSSGFSMRARLLKDPGNDLVEGWILHAHIDHAVARQNRVEHLANLAAPYLEVYGRTLAFGHLTIAIQVVGCRTIDEFEFHELIGAKALGNAGQIAIVNE